MNLINGCVLFADRAALPGALPLMSGIIRPDRRHVEPPWSVFLMSFPSPGTDARRWSGRGDHKLRLSKHAFWEKTAGPWGFRTNRSHPPDQPGPSPNGSRASTACSGSPRPNRSPPRTVRGRLRLARGFNGPIGAVPGPIGAVPGRTGGVYGLPVGGKGRLGGFNGRFGAVPGRFGDIHGLPVGGYKTVTPASATSTATPSLRFQPT